MVSGRGDRMDWVTVVRALGTCLLIVLATSHPALGAEVPQRLGSFGPDGTEASDFERVNGVAVDQESGVVYVLDGTAGALFKFTADGTPLAFTGSNPDIEGNRLTGLSETQGIRQVAVDPVSHKIYVTERTAVRVFEADGEPAEFSAGPGAGSNAIPGFDEASGVAVDANGTIYASDGSSWTVRIYDSGGAELTSFPATQPGNLAVAADGAVYVVAGFFGIGKYVPSEFPVTPSTTYQGSSFLTLFSAVAGLGIDSLEGEIYVLESASRAWIGQYDEDGKFVRYIGRPGGEGELGAASRGLAVVNGGEEFQLYASDTEAESSEVAIFGEEVFEEQPAIKATWAADITADSATLHAEINPNTAETVYRFEYGFEPCESSTCTSVPLGDGEIDAGHHFVSVAEQILDLEPGTTYHYRVVAENAFGVTSGPDVTLNTGSVGFGFQLADSRVWEMVTPTDKHGAKIGSAGQGTLIQAAADGDGLAYITGGGSIEPDPEGNRAIEASSVLAHRDGAGRWSSKDITPSHSEPTIILRSGSEYQLFSSDLARAILLPGDGTLLSPEASERTIYLRENTDPPAFIPLLTGKEGFANVPPGTEFGEGNGGIRSAAYVLGATKDLSYIVLTAEVPLITGAPINALYEWHDGQLNPITKLPAADGGNWYEDGVSRNTAELGSGRGSVENAVSADGSRVFWSPGRYNEFTPTLSALYLRDVEAENTVRIDTVQAGASGAGAPGPVFQGANSDGTVVFFTDTRQLTVDASPEGRDLYRCEIPAGESAGGCSSLTDVTPSPGPGESAEVLGLASGLGEDGATISFVARGVLDSTPNSYGQSAVAGEPNLYRWQQGQEARFIATLSKEDRRSWGSTQDVAGSAPLGMSLAAASSPNGRYFAFMSERGLTGEPNLDAISGEPDQQVFVYDTKADELHCASCAFSRGRPRGRKMPGDRTLRVDPVSIWPNQSVAAILPDTTATGGEGPFGPLYRPRAILDNGRVFFNSVDSLVPGDSNGQWDVYEYEPTGTGSCTPDSKGASTVSSSFGCVALISSGTGEEEAAFLDASASGDDVFFTTAAQLSALDGDALDDIYDARVGGIAAQRQIASECLGEACQVASNPPNDLTPGSAAFQGPGNVASRHCKKGKRRIARKGRTRCVRIRHKKHKPKRHAGRGQQSGRRA